jgi:photosystem II stability/assembly factor-like uncharacterized protein
MNPSPKRLTPLLGLLVLLAGCGKATTPTGPTPIPPLASLTLSPGADTLVVGQTRVFTATAMDTAGQPYTGRLQWSTSDAGVFTVSSTGLVRAAGEGSAQLFVEGGGQRDSAQLLVYPVASGWFAQTSQASEDLNGVFFDAAGRLGWAVGEGGLILSTTDAGATWTRLRPTTFSLHGVWFTNAQEGWAVGNGGTVLTTQDGGSTWTRLANAGTSENLRHVYFASADIGWVVGSNGVLMRTDDGGASWHTSYLGGLTLNGVMFSGQDHGWAVGEGGIILGTHDGGHSWFVVQPSITGVALRSVWRRTAEQAVAVGAQGVVARTVVTPDSVAWTLGNAGSSRQLEGVCFPTSQTGYAVGYDGGGLVLRSDDGGASWHPQTSASQFRLRAVFFVDERRGWAVGENGTIRHTASGGE